MSIFRDAKPLGAQQESIFSLDRIKRERAEAVRTSYNLGRLDDPEEYGKRLERSQQTGIHPAFVDLDEPSPQPLIDFEGMTEQRPALANFIADPTNATLAQDDIEDLEHKHDLLRIRSDKSESDFASGIRGIDIVGDFSKDVGERGIENFTREELERYQARSAALKAPDGTIDTAQNIAGSIVGMGAKSLDGALAGASTGAGIGAGVAGAPGALAGAKIGAAFGMRAEAARESFHALRGEFMLDLMSDPEFAQMDRQDILDIGNIVGAAGAVLEVAGLEVFGRQFVGAVKTLVRGRVKERIKEVGPKDAFIGYGKTVAGTSLFESGIEAVQQTIGDIGGQLVRQSAGLVDTTALDDPDKAVEAAANTLTTFGQMLGPMTLVSSILPTPKLVVDLSAAQKADENARVFEALAGESKLGDRSSEKYGEFVSGVTKDGPLEKVQISAEELLTLFQNENVDIADAEISLGLAPGTIEREAEATGFVSVDTGKYAEKLARSRFHQTLADHMRFNADEMTAAEAREFNEKRQAELKEEAERIRAEIDTNTQTQEIYTQFRDGLVQAGRTPDVAEKEAILNMSIIRTLAEREGLDPLILFRSRGLTIEGVVEDPQTAGDLILEQTRRNVTERIQRLEEAAQGLKEGRVTQEEYQALVNELKPVRPYESVPSPESDGDMLKALHSNKQERLGVPSQTLQGGERVGVRLDIPAYSEHGTWVVSIHEDKAGFAAGKSIGYESTAVLNNVDLGVVQKAAQNIAAGKPKATIAVMKGDWQKMTPEEAKALADQAFEEGWTQVGMDPTRHAYFYDRTNQEPIVAAEQVVQIGPLVLAKNPTYGDRSTFLFQSGVTDGVQGQGQEAAQAVGPEPGETRQEYEARAAKQAEEVFADYEAAKAAYRELEIDGATGAKILNVDEARELVPMYRADRSLAGAIHPATSDFMDRLFEEHMTREIPGDTYKQPVIFSAGGAGSGKGGSLKALGRDMPENFDWMLDGTLKNFDDAVRDIGRLTERGHRVVIAYTFRPPEKALLGAIQRTLNMAAKKGTGRTVPLEAFAKGHEGARDTIEKLAEVFKDDPDVEVRMFDNSSDTKGNVKEVSVDQLPEKRHNVLEEARRLLDDEYAQGYFSAAIYRGFAGKEPPASDQGGRGVQEDIGQASREVLEGNEPRGPPQSRLNQDPETPRGQIEFSADRQQTVIRLFESRDLSTFLHESGHFYLELMMDLAERDGASDQIKADVQEVFNWLGISSRADLTAEHHEQWARGFELYLAEGNSPSENLRSIFATFRTWMISVYRNLRNLNVEINDNIRGVMDRMVATDDEIAIARQQVREPFTDQESAGMTDKQWADYQAALQRARMSAEEAVAAQAMAEARAEAEAVRKAQKSRIKEEEAERIAAEPVYRAIRFMRGKLEIEGVEPVKFSRNAVKELDPDYLKRLPQGRGSLIAKGDGVHPDTVAAMFGFSSGDELIQAIINNPSEKQAVEKAVKERIKAEVADLSATPEQTAEIVQDAIHNPDNMEVLVREMRALSRQAKRPMTASSILRQAALDFIAGMKLRDIRPNDYLAAERRAARFAAEAIANGNVEDALKFKQRQLYNMHLYTAARNAVKEADALQKRVKRYDKKSTRERLGKAGVLDQIDKILERFEFRKVALKQLDRRQALRDFIAEQESNGIVVDIPETVLNEANRLNYKELTVEELRGISDSLKAIEHLARVKNRLIDARDQRELDDIAKEINDEIEANSKGERANVAEASGLIDKTADFFNGIFAAHRKLSSLFRQMDGHKDQGALARNIMNRINEAGDQEAALNEKVARELTEILKDAPSTVRPNKRYFPHIDQSLTHWGRLMIALNWGNETNRKRLMKGEGWSQADVEAILDTLTEQDWQLVQKILDYIDGFWPAIADKQERVTGVRPEKVEAAPIQTKYGVFRGGYFPIKYDPDKSNKAREQTDAEIAESMKKGAKVAASTRRGHTKERAEDVDGLSLLLDPSVITRHLTEVVHDLTHHEMLIDVNRIMRRVRSTIRSHYGPRVVEAIDRALEDIASGQMGAQNWYERSLTHIRNGSSIAFMGWSLSTALMQPIGMTQSIHRIGPRYMMAGLQKFIGSPKKMSRAVEDIHKLSPMMRERSLTMNRQINDIRNKIAKKGPIEETYFWLVTRMQMVVDVPTWLGAYEKAQAEGMTEEQAIKAADQTVIDTQGGGQIKDLALVQRGHPFYKLFTNFYSYFSTLFNLSAESINRTKFSDPLSVGRLAVDYLLLYTIPATLTLLVKDGFSGSDDDEEFTDRLIKEQISMLAGTMVLAREMQGAISADFGYQGPAGLAFFSSFTRLIDQIEQGEFDEALAKALLQTAGLLFHFPTVQTERLLEGGYRLLEGETDNPIELLTGERKE